MKNLRTKLLLALILCVPCYGQTRPQVKVLDDWALIAQNAVREGATHEISNWQSTTVHISCAIGSLTPHTGTKIIVQISPVDSGDEAWLNHLEFLGPVGTATTAVMTVVPNTASKTILAHYASTAGLFDDDGVRTIFLLGSPTVANSELCTLVSHVSGAASSVTVIDALANTPGASSTWYDIAETYIIEIPEHNNRLRIIYDNTYDSNGSSAYTYCTLYGVKP